MSFDYRDIVGAGDTSVKGCLEFLDGDVTITDKYGVIKGTFNQQMDSSISRSSSSRKSSRSSRSS
jgi:TBC1 domain family member 10